MRLTLAVPHLLALDAAALAAAPSLARLARYAGPPDTRRGDLDTLLASASPASATAGSAPLAAVGAGLDAGTSYVLRADPVSLVAGRNDVALAARIDDLDGDEAAAMIGTLNAHFAGDGLTFRAPRADAWFVLQDAAPDLTTTPLAAVRGAIYPWLPAGGDAARWRRWLSEMQMLLHAHPANAAREARGRVPVTGVWISEGGRGADLPRGDPTAIFVPPGAPGDVARGLARLRGMATAEPPKRFADLPLQRDAIVVLAHGDAADAPQLLADWLGPAVAALERGTLASLSLLADGDGIAAAWHAVRPTWRARALARMAATPFAPPLRGEDDA
jgi:hypothetical protein